MLEALRRARLEGGDAGAAARLVLQSRALHSRTRRRVADALFALARAAATLDARIRHAARTQPLEHRLSPERRDVLRLAALQAGEAGGPAASVAEDLGLPGELVEALASPAFLDSLDGPARLAVETGMPRWLVEMLVAGEGDAEARAVLASLNERAPLTLRARGPRAALLEELRAQGVMAEPTSFSSVGVRLLRHVNVRAVPAFQAGRCEVQDEGSQLIALAVAPQDGELVIDGCAGAGGKTLALASLAPRARVVAVEPEASRLRALRERAARAGVRVQTVQAPMGDAALRPFLGQAHAVLVDAPCSGTGALRREPENRWRYSREDIADFAARQLQIAHQSTALLRPGGRLVYATCSLLQDENEHVLQALRNKVPTLVPLPLAEVLGADLAQRLGAPGHALRLRPHRHGTDGFFLAALRRP